MLVCDPTVFPLVEALRRLQGITLKTGQRLNALNIPSSTPSTTSPHLEPRDVAFAPLKLPFPEEVLTPLLKLNASESLRDPIRTFFIKRIAELQLKCTTNYQQTCRFVAKTAQPARNRRLQEAYLNFYRHQCHAIVETQLPYVLKELAKLAQQHGTTKSEFNHEYTPILECYFAYNAYPSLPDRLLLARKSMMTPRQIEVWFQNHRNRARKDGVTLRRLSPHAPSTFALDQHAPQAVNLRRSKSITADIGASYDDVSSTDREEHLCRDYRPSHAFPTPYSAKSGSNPFSLDNQPFRHTSLDWIRSPETQAPQHSSLTVDDLTGLFAQMNMRGTAQPSRGCKSALKCKWSSTFLVAPSTAPHPAILNPGYASPLPVIQASDSCTWQKPSLRSRKPTRSRSQVSYPSWAVPDAFRRRKSPSIPRRIPLSQLNSHCFAASPRTSSASSASSSTSSILTRSTSLSSLTSETTVEPEPISPPETVMSNLIDMADYTSVDTQWDFNRSGSLPLPQDAFPGLPQGFHLPDFVTMDLPPFMFFES